MKVRIQEDYMRNSYKIFAFEIHLNKEHYLHYNDGKIERIEIDREMAATDGAIKPLIELPRMVFHLLMPELIQQGNEMGIRTENENHLKGKLEATEFHLKDLQQISKKLLKIE